MDEGHTSIRNGFYGHQYCGNNVERDQEHNRNILMGLMGSDGMDPSMVGGQTLDEIINQNNKELQRRRSYQQLYDSSRPNEEDMRRASMMGFGSGGNSDLDGFQFDLSPVPNNGRIGRGGGIAARRTESHRAAERRQSRGDISLNAQFHDLGPTFNPMPQSGPYQQQLNPSETLNLDVGGTHLPGGLPMGMDFSTSGLEQDASGDMTPMNMYTQSDFQPTMTTSPLHQAFPSSLRGLAQDPGAGNAGGREEQDMMEKMPNMQMSDQMQSLQTNLGQSKLLLQRNSPVCQPRGLRDLNASNEPQPDPPVVSAPDPKLMSLSTGEPGANTGGTQADLPKFPNAYSSSGFDMLGVLSRVAARPNPQINIGAVDMSCAFVVCNVTEHDIPIVYCSDIFERLTGYSKHEILGRNCRFLQAPDGKVQSGVKRKYVDDDIIFHLKNMVNKRSEVQTSLINYRKGGQPFMNLLTMIPITWNSDEIKYYVGFQVDLVETPNSVTNKNPDGSYAINYQRGLLPRYVFRTPENNHQHAELGQTIPRDEVSTVLSTIGTAEESELSKRILDKVLLENTDDVVHVLSLKGLFLYLSPSSRKVLEYEPAELIGTPLSSVCHPSDIVPVTRELKDTSSGASVNVVFRIRRKHSGYTWFESHGSLHTEQGKGRKCIILVGRERPVYALARGDIVSAGGIGESELWTKMSTSGMFLFVSSNVRTLLDRQPDDLVGTSVQTLMRPDSKVEFGRILELARTGKRASFKHDMQNKRGQVLSAQTTIYPGDAVEGSKPTFLVAQTRLLKLSRSLPVLNRQGAGMSSWTDQASAGSGTPSTNLSPGSTGPQLTGQTSVTPQSSTSTVYPEGVVTTAGGNGLAIGTQDLALASEENVFDELKTTRSTSWQFELRQMEKRNRLLAEELQSLLSSKKKRKRRKGAGQSQKDCANCHTRVTPEWRRGPSGNRDLCNSCGLRWAKQNGRVSPRTSSQHSDKQNASPAHSSPVVGEYVFNNMNRPPPSSLPFPEKRPPQSVNADSHGAKTKRMEAMALQGYGGGILPKIEEGVEPREGVLSII